MQEVMDRLEGRHGLTGKGLLGLSVVFPTTMWVASVSDAAVATLTAVGIAVMAALVFL